MSEMHLKQPEIIQKKRFLEKQKKQDNTKS